MSGLRVRMGLRQSSSRAPLPPSGVGPLKRNAFSTWTSRSLPSNGFVKNPNTPRWVAASLRDGSVGRENNDW